jgi:hypothetical protein
MDTLITLVIAAAICAFFLLGYLKKQKARAESQEGSRKG